MHRADPEERARVVALIAPGQRVFTPDQMRVLLGGIGKSAYYELRKSGRLRFTRLERGGKAVHTIKQYEDFVNLLDTEEVNGPIKRRRGNHAGAQVEEH
jgi:hypothetical protein